MPQYSIQCKCGGLDGFCSIKERDEHEGKVPCYDCDTWCDTKITGVKVVGASWAGGKYFAQLDKTFDSARQMEQWASKEGLEPVSRSSDRWQGLKDNSKNLADSEARQQGFTDARDRKVTLSSKAEEYVNANKQTQINAHHDEHGSEGRKTVEEFA